MLSGFLGRNKLHQINFPGLPQLHAWGLNAVKSTGAKWTAGLQLSTSASLSISAPSMIHMEQGNIPGSTLSLMQSRLLPTLEHVQQRRRQQNAPPCITPHALGVPQSCALHTDVPNARTCNVFTGALPCSTSPLFTAHILPIPRFTASPPLYPHVFTLHIPSSCLDNVL
jgi:hypothetical protein